MRISDWSSDVCSSDLTTGRQHGLALLEEADVLRLLGRAVPEVQVLQGPLLVVRTGNGLAGLGCLGAGCVGRAVDLELDLRPTRRRPGDRLRALGSGLRDAVVDRGGDRTSVV